MSLRIHSTVVATVMVVSLAVSLPLLGQQRLPDSTLFTIYNTNQPRTQIEFSVCGSLPQSEGCYGGGGLGPFTNACAIVQSVPAPLNINVVLRYIYVLDTGSSTGGATLTAYKRTDTITPSFDTIRVTTVAVVPLPTLVAGPSATCLMAQNPAYVYVATTQGSNLLAVNKEDFSVTLADDNGLNISALTADSYGFVTADWGTQFNEVFGPNGGVQSEGGGAYFMINPIDAIYLADVPPFDRPSSPMVGYSLKIAK